MKHFNQRAKDVFMSIVLAPLFLSAIFIISLLIIVIDRSYPFYSQKRVGKNGKLFTVNKFRTMSMPAKGDINDKIKDTLRMTSLGAWLRNRGLDELLQILNVIIGDMSFMGPRPLLEINIEEIRKKNPELIDKIEEWESMRSSAKPGISGWHQVHSLSSGILKYDMEYLKNPSFSKQLKIFFVSLLIILVGKKVYFTRFPSGI